jgi:hypothetical protein
MPTTPHDATVFPEDTLYIKSPAETEALILAELEEIRTSYTRNNNVVRKQYRDRASLWATGITGTNSQRSFTGGVVPDDLDTLKARGALGQSTAWGANDAIRLGDRTWAKWSGTAWIAAYPTALNGNVFTDWPGVNATTPPLTTGMNRLLASPTSAWTGGNKITVNGFLFTWNGTAWVATT